jgi:hypothetical protein
MPLARRTRVRTLFLTLLGALAACQDTTAPPTDLPPGSMLLEVSGDTTFSVTGLAVYGNPQMTLTDQAGTQDTDFVQLFVEAPANPQERRYDGLTTGSTFFIVRGSSVARQFQSTSGWLDLYMVTGGTVSGHGELTLQEMDSGGQPIAGKRITIRAVFNANRS